MNAIDYLTLFLTEQSGRIVCISDDFSLFRSLRYSIAEITPASDDILVFHEDPEAATKDLERFYKDGVPFVVFIERKVDGRITTDIVLRISRLYPSACLIVVGTNITKEVASYLFEIGTSSIISKPASAEDVLGKLRNCLKVSRESALTSHVRELVASSSQQEALEAVEKFLRLNPESSVGYCLKGDILITTGDLDQAVEAYNHSSRLNLYYTEPLKRMATIHKYANDEKAIRMLERIDNMNPFNPDRKLEMAEIYLRQGDVSKAEKAFDQGYRQASKEFSLLLGDYAERIALLASSVPELAEGYLAKVIKTKKVFTLLDIHMFNRLGMLLRNKGEWKEAVEVYKKALMVAPDDPVLYYNMALAYHGGGKRDEAKRCLSKSLSIDSRFYADNEGVTNNIGTIYLDYGDKDVAKPFFEHVLEINAENSKAAKKLARCQQG